MPSLGRIPDAMSLLSRKELERCKPRLHSSSVVEVQYLWNEIVTDGQYQHESLNTLPPNAVVVDVGANIGIFALWSQTLASNPTIHAIEANPTIARLCEKNSALERDWTTHNVAISDKDDESLAFRVYPNATGWSTCAPYAPHEEALRRDLWQFVENKAGEWLGTSVWGLLNTPLKPLFYLAWTWLSYGAHTVRVPAMTLSSWMRAESIDSIDLLKIDVEKHEWNVLRGIKAEDWGKIKRVVLEVEENHDAIQHMLETHGFQVKTKTDPNLRGTPYVMMWGWKI